MPACDKGRVSVRGFMKLCNNAFYSTMSTWSHFLKNWTEIADITLASTMSAAVLVITQTTITLVYFHDAILQDHIFIIERNTLKTLFIFVMSLMTEAMAV
jgi:hypothetical protein